MYRPKNDVADVGLHKIFFTKYVSVMTKKRAKIDFNKYHEQEIRLNQAIFCDNLVVLLNMF